MWTATLLLAGVVTGLVTPSALRALPEPRQSDEQKIPYRALATPGVALGIGACSAAALAVMAARLFLPLWPLWAPLATIGVLLAGIDAMTTWLPLRLTHALWIATAIGGVVSLIPVGTVARGTVALRMLIGAALVGGFFWLFWRVMGGLGFGDVRLAPVLGAVTASVSWQVLVMGLLIGTGLGAMHGLVRHVRGRAGPFPYGPALVAGSFVALAGFG